MRPYLTWENALKRYPRLVRLMQYVAILSESEAACGIRDYINARNGHLDKEMIQYGGGEAVCHFGGPLKVIQYALRLRRWNLREIYYISYGKKLAAGL